MADINGDGLLDLATGWEEGGVIRVYVNPGFTRSSRTSAGKPAVTQPWPAVTVGRVRSPEDAVFADLDGDGTTDVVSSCEGGNKTIFVHWAPREHRRYLTPDAWSTEPLPASQDQKQWMFCLPLQMDGLHGVDLFAGAKGPGAEVGWFEAPENPRDLAAWKWHPLCPVGWIMSLAALDVDDDGDEDIVFSDRKGGRRGCYWLERPGPEPARGPADWTLHGIGGRDREVMFLAPARIEPDRGIGFVVAVSGGDLLWLRRVASAEPLWEEHVIRMPPEAGTGKSAAIADVNLDGRIDVLFSAENAAARSGVMWLSYDPDMGPVQPEWTAHDISGRSEGVKFDLLQLLDLDGDGDLDVITCEERDNLGVIWYENPTRSFR